MEHFASSPTYIHVGRCEPPAHESEAADRGHVGSAVLLNVKGDGLDPLEPHVLQLDGVSILGEVGGRQVQDLRGIDVVDVLEAKIDPVHKELDHGR